MNLGLFGENLEKHQENPCNLASRSCIFKFGLWVWFGSPTLSPPPEIATHRARILAQVSEGGERGVYGNSERWKRPTLENSENHCCFLVIFEITLKNWKRNPKFMCWGVVERMRAKTCKSGPPKNQDSFKILRSAGKNDVFFIARQLKIFWREIYFTPLSKRRAFCISPLKSQAKRNAQKWIQDNLCWHAVYCISITHRNRKTFIVQDDTAIHL